MFRIFQVLKAILKEQHTKDVRVVRDPRMVSELCRKKQGGGQYVTRIDQAIESGWKHDSWPVRHNVRNSGV